MSFSPVALATPHQNIIHCIIRFVEAIEQAGREPAPSECEHVQRALAALEELDFPRGEQAMMWAEWFPDRRSPEASVNLRPTFETISTAVLRDSSSASLRESPGGVEAIHG